jgi:hypothetical protein
MRRAAWRSSPIGPKSRASAAWVYASTALSLLVCSPTTAEDLAAGSQLDSSHLAYTRLYCTSDNESHFGGVEVGLARQNFAPPAASIFIGGNRPASSTFFAGFEARWGAADLANHLYHPTPAVQLLTVVRGQFSITTTDGETKQLHTGDVVQLEDVAPCKGHITVVGDTTGFLLFARP